MPGVNQNFTPKKISAVEKERQCLELRKAGATFEQIAKEVGYKFPSGAEKAIRRALKKTIQQPADDLRKLMILRLDRMLLAIWPSIQTGDTKAILAALKIEERRARLLGLDSPSRVEVHDWRKQAEQAGIDVSDVYEELVQRFAMEFSGDDSSG